MRKTIFIFFAVMSSFFILQSCVSDPFILSEPLEIHESIALRIALNSLKENDSTNTGMEINDDFDFVYPIFLKYNNDTFAEIYNEDAFTSLLFGESINTHITGIAMPFEVTLKNNSVQKITSENNFLFLLSKSQSVNFPTALNFKGDCFDFVYPFQLITTNGTLYKILTKTSFDDFIKNHWEEWGFELVYPLEVIPNAGQKIAIHNTYEFFDRLKSCF